MFIGHGRSNVWYQLKNFLNDRLSLQSDEFNAESVAGILIVARLQELLDNACFAILVMTGEDLHADEQAHARENVIREAGLFQGRPGFQRAIIQPSGRCPSGCRPDLGSSLSADLQSIFRRGVFELDSPKLKSGWPKPPAILLLRICALLPLLFTITTKFHPLIARIPSLRVITESLPADQGRSHPHALLFYV